MHLRALGTDGLEVSAIGLGYMGLSANYGEPVDEAAGIALEGSLRRLRTGNRSGPSGSPFRPVKGVPAVGNHQPVDLLTGQDHPGLSGQRPQFGGVPYEVTGGRTPATAASHAQDTAQQALLELDRAPVRVGTITCLLVVCSDAAVPPAVPTTGRLPGPWLSRSQCLPGYLATT
jgi:hypothetical protein